MFILRLLSRRWLLTTLLALAAVAVMLRLGIWQLDRLEQRRAFNARVLAQLDAPQLLLDAGAITLDLYEMEYRSVQVSGVYDFGQQVALRNQVWNNRAGVHLLTPLRIAGTDTSVLVDRGWIPNEDSGLDGWNQYNQPGEVNVQGILRRPQTEPDFGGVPDPTLAPGQAALLAWNLVNLERLAAQISDPLLPVYVQETPQPGDLQPPIPSETELDLSEGPHFGYALQWFAFAAILAIGYPVYAQRQSAPTHEPKPMSEHEHD